MLFVLFFLIEISSEISIFSIIAFLLIAFVVEEHQKKKHSDNGNNNNELHIWRKLLEHNLNYYIDNEFLGFSIIKLESQNLV